MSWGHKILSLARLPVPPRPHIFFRLIQFTIFARVLQEFFYVFQKIFLRPFRSPWTAAYSNTHRVFSFTAAPFRVRIPRFYAHNKTYALRTSVLLWCGQRDFKATLRVSSVLRLPFRSPWTAAYSNTHRVF